MHFILKTYKKDQTELKVCLYLYILYLENCKQNSKYEFQFNALACARRADKFSIKTVQTFDMSASASVYRACFTYD